MTLKRLAVTLMTLLLAIAPAVAIADGPVHVKGYYRNVGTYVALHSRAAPHSHAAPIVGAPKTGHSIAPRPAVVHVSDSPAPPKQTHLPPPEIVERPAGAHVDANGRFIDQNGILRDADGRIHRKGSAKHAFELINPCPATGASSGPCSGYVVDHILPLKRGGADAPSNMQWQTIEAARAKDKVE